MNIPETSQTVEKAARIVYFGLYNPKKISQNREFINLFKEYEISSELQEFVRAIANGFELDVIQVEKTGVFLYPKTGSIFTPRISDIPILGKEKNKDYLSLILLAIAAYFYPQMHHFEHPGYSGPGIDAVLIDKYIREKVDSIIEKMDPEELYGSVDEPGLDKLLLKYRRLKKSGDKITEQSSSFYLIRKALDFLKNQRMLIEDGDKYFPSKRFKYQMEELATSEIFNNFIGKISEDDLD